MKEWSEWEMSNKWGKLKNKDVTECKKDGKCGKRINNKKEIGLECAIVALRIGVHIFVWL